MSRATTAVTVRRSDLETPFHEFDVDNGIASQNFKMPMRYKMGIAALALTTLSAIAVMIIYLLRKNNNLNNEPALSQNFTEGEVAVALQLYNASSSLRQEAYDRFSCSDVQKNLSININNTFFQHLTAIVALFLPFNFTNCSNMPAHSPMMIRDDDLCSDPYPEVMEPAQALQSRVMDACKTMQTACKSGINWTAAVFGNVTHFRRFPSHPENVSIDSTVTVGCNLPKTHN